MNAVISKYVSVSLIARIAIGMVVGAVLGLILPSLRGIGILGDFFVGGLKGVAPVLVFILVLNSLANARQLAGGRFKTVTKLYLLATFFAACTAVVGSFLFPLTIQLDLAGATTTPPGGLGEILGNLFAKMVENPILALSRGDYVGILFWAIVFGLCLKKFAKPETLTFMADLSSMVSDAVRVVIEFAPFGICGLMFSVVSENGLAIFVNYGKLLLLLVGCMLVVALVVDPLIVFFFTRENPYPLVLRCLRESGVTAFFTRSSAANIPINMSLCKKLGLDPDFYSVSIPLGATINMGGAAVTITVMTLAVANTMGVHLDFSTTVMLSFLSTLGACGASGVAGGSLLLIPMACSLFGIINDIAMQAVAVGFVIGVVQDSVETAINSSTDVIFTATAETYKRRTGKKEESA
ncbi:MAG: serine/threonine transporter SstT [Desulfovibrionaceae bacterium]|nr:serine/threonine transporter SstT [Desulfovibrionaceae bacterium]